MKTPQRRHDAGERTCTMCGATYDAHRVNQATCSTRCSEARAKAENARRYRAKATTPPTGEV